MGFILLYAVLAASPFPCALAPLSPQAPFGQLNIAITESLGWK